MGSGTSFSVAPPLKSKGRKGGTANAYFSHLLHIRRLWFEPQAPEPVSACRINGRSLQATVTPLTEFY